MTAYDAMLAACEAITAWHWAEDNRGPTISHDDCMELCRYSRWLAQNALRIVRGEPEVDESYSGVPHLIIWPAVYLSRAEGDEARALVERVLAQYRTALAATVKS